MAERADAVTYAVPFDDGTLAVGQAAVADALFLKEFAGSVHTEAAEIVGVVVGQVEVVEARICQQVGIPFGHTESVVVGVGGVLGADATFADDAFKVAGRQVGVQEQLLDIGKDIPALIFREPDGGIGGAHHDVAAKGERQQRVRRLGAGLQGKQSQQEEE